MIVTNPPLKSAAQFAAHALLRVVMLLRLTFRECARRNAILDGGPRARVHVFRNQLPMPATAARGTAFQIRRQATTGSLSTSHTDNNEFGSPVRPRSSNRKLLTAQLTAPPRAQAAGGYALRRYRCPRASHLRPGRHRDRCGRAQRACCLRHQRRRGSGRLRSRRTRSFSYDNEFSDQDSRCRIGWHSRFSGAPSGTPARSRRRDC